MLGRPRNFEEEDALEQATDLFWRQGYAPTSLNDLLEHMGISRQSLYNTFGDKQQLFRRVLDHYVETRMGPWFAQLEAPSANLDSIQTYLEGIARLSSVPGATRKGCLMVNTLVDMPIRDSPAGKAVRRAAVRLEKAMLSALENAKTADQLAPRLDLGETATFLATVAHGLMVAGKAGASRKQQEATARLALAAVRL